MRQEEQAGGSGAALRFLSARVGFSSVMEAYYYLVFGVLVAVLAALEFSKSSKDRITTSAAFNAFKNNYLVVYSLMMGNVLAMLHFLFYLWA